MSYRLLPYNQSLGLLTDLYQLTMAYGYWKEKMMERESVFHMLYRKNPFGGGFSVTAGLAYVIDVLENFGFDQTDLDYIKTLTGTDNKPLFEQGFLDYLAKLKFECDVDAMPEGTVAFPQEPLLRVQGPLIQAQLIESILLNAINFQTLIATKAARVNLAAKGDPVLEFGLRRAHGFDGALAASRAAYIGGCAGTSNVLAGKMFGIPVKGTQAHSWIMVFDDELSAMKAYAKALPNNAFFLVDTYDSLEGVKKAVEVGKWLKSEGHVLAGIRLDSGDLAYLSVETRKILDVSGFKDTKILASNDLDENIITSLKEQGAKIVAWGVGTKLATATGDPALGGVYKLSAIRGKGKEWSYKIKLSEQSVKVSNPGILNVRRFYTGTENSADVIYDIHSDLKKGCVIVDPLDSTRQKKMTPETSFQDLLVPVFKNGKCVYDSPPIDKIQQKAQKHLAHFHSGVKRLVNPHQYPVGLEKSLHELKTNLILKARRLK
jgi:nicotinate phosphoribosyltransferase